MFNRITILLPENQTNKIYCTEEIKIVVGTFFVVSSSVMGLIAATIVTLLCWGFLTISSAVVFLDQLVL